MDSKIGADQMGKGSCPYMSLKEVFAQETVQANKPCRDRLDSHDAPGCLF
jgi:hypothetical protein